MLSLPSTRFAHRRPRRRSVTPSLTLVCRVLFAVCAALLLGGQAAIAFGQTAEGAAPGGLSPVAFILTVFGAVITWLLHRGVTAAIKAIGIQTTAATLNALDAAIAQAIGWAQARIESQAGAELDAIGRRNATVRATLDLLETHFDQIVTAAGLTPDGLAQRIEATLGTPRAASPAPASATPQPAVAAAATAACLLFLVGVACLAGCSSAQLATAQQDIANANQAVVRACADYQAVKPDAAAIATTVDPKSAAAVGIVVSTADTVCAALTAATSAPAAGQ